MTILKNLAVYEIQHVIVFLLVDVVVKANKGVDGYHYRLVIKLIDNQYC